MPAGTLTRGSAPPRRQWPRAPSAPRVRVRVTRRVRVRVEQKDLEMVCVVHQIALENYDAVVPVRRNYLGRVRTE